MKMNKILAVLLSVAMLVGIIPAFSVSVSAANVGEVVNGGFETTYTYDRSGTERIGATGWTISDWYTTIQNSTKKSGSYSARISSHSDATNAIVAQQVVPVNTNATYTLSFYLRGGKDKTFGFFGSTQDPCVQYKIELGTKADSFSYTVVSSTTPTRSPSSFTQNTKQFTTGSYKYARITFTGTGSGDNDSYIDDVSLIIDNAGDTGTHAKPSFVDFGNELNRPKDSASNEVAQPSFESTTDAPWNVSTFIKTNLSVANDPDAKDGSKVLLYSNPTTTESWHYFDLDLPTGGNYVLSAWVKSPFLSANNQATASIGIVDPDTNKFFMSGLANYKGHTSTPYLQIRSTATDNQWHLRSVTFFVGSAGTVKIGVYGKQSQLYIDDISVHLVTNGVTYKGDQTGTLSAANNSDNKYCESANNLIVDCNMTGDNAEKFWKGNASGWNNGFMNFNKEEQRLEFNGTGASGKKVYHYIKWIDVEPNTKYTVTFDYRITEKGTGQLRFLDNNIDLPVAFKTYSFSATTNDWTETSFTFTSGNYNRIAIAFTDGTGKAYFDDFRIFKTADGIAIEPDEEIYPTLTPSHPDKYVSRMEMESGKLGLGFLFTLDATDVTRNEKFEADYSDGKVQPFENGKDYKLVAVGAVMTNDGEVGQNADIFIRENQNEGKTVIDVNAKYLFNDPTNPEHEGYDENLGYAPKIYFAMRITNIPETHAKAVIYARPYYVFEYSDGRQITLYGDIVFESYEPQKDVNDGWMEWE